MKAPDPEGRIDVSTEELEALLEQAKQEPLREEGYQPELCAGCESVVEI